MIVGAGVLGVRRADEGEVFDPGDVVRVGPVKVAARVVLVQGLERPRFLQQSGQLLGLDIATVAPMDRVGKSQGGDVLDPAGESGEMG